MNLRLWLKTLMFPGCEWISRDKTRVARHLLRGTATAPVRTLDCGCGNAYFTWQAWRRGSVCTGITLHERELAACEEMRDHLGVPAQQMRFAVRRLAELARDDAQRGAFEQVLLLDVLEHIRDDAQALEHVHALLAPDGFLYVSVPNRDWSGAAHALRVSRFEDGWHVRNGYTFEQLEALLMAHGFEPLDRLRFGSLGSRCINWLQSRLFRGLRDPLTIVLFPVLQLLAVLLAPFRDPHTLLVIARKTASDPKLRPGITPPAAR